MAEKAPTITQLEFTPADHVVAKRVARALGYAQYAYTSSSALWGLFCLKENPANYGTGYVAQRRTLPPFVNSCIIKTAEFGLMVVQDLENLGLDAEGNRS